MSLLMASLIPHFVGDGRQTIENNQRRQHLIIKIDSSRIFSIACHETSSCQNIFKNLHSNLFLLKHENIYALVYKKDFFNNEHRRGAEEARRAHNPKDGGPKPPDDKLPCGT